MIKSLILVFSHGVVLMLGFALGIYSLPILTAPISPNTAVLTELMQQSHYVGSFSAERIDSDFLHKGEGQFTVGPSSISFIGKLSPGPNFKLYLSPEFIETKADFLAKKAMMVDVAYVNTFDNFSVKLPADIDPSKYTTVIIWCESFEQYITSGSYTLRTHD
jgi:hypothetical protein